jgi:hypothetical protein
MRSVMRSLLQRSVPICRVWLVIVGGGIAGSLSSAEAQDGSHPAGVELPAETVQQLLEYGLNADGPRVITNCEDSARFLVASGANQTEVDLALALAYARFRRFEDMRRLLDKTAVAAPQDVRVLRLHSWAQLSDRQYEQGLNTILALLRTVTGGDSDATERQSQVQYAGAAFGFATVAIPAVKPGLLPQIDDIHEAALAAISPDSVAAFRDAETAMSNKVSAAIASIKQAQADDSEQVTAEKQAVADKLREQQQQLEGEAQQRQAQARSLQETAHATLADIAQRAAPYQRELAKLQAQLSQLHAIRSSKEEDFEKEVYDPQILSVETEISFVQASLSPLIAEYNRIEQNAMMALNALGARYQQLGRVHQANKTRMRKNENRSEAGVNARVKTQLGVQTRLAAHLALDFNVEKDRVLEARETAKP